MISSFAHNFIFIKTRKTAGTSIELVLGNLCDTEDIITPCGIDEQIRWEHGWRGAQNFIGDAGLEREYADIASRRDIVAFQKFQKNRAERHKFWNHMPARILIGRLDRTFWSRSHKWAIERHPYERAVSAAYFRIWKDDLPPASFQTVLNDLITKDQVDDRKKYTIDGCVAVDEIIKFEELSIAFPRLLAKFGLSFDGELPRAKTHQRVDRRPAHEILSQKQKDQIYASCQATFEMLGYEH
jgi:hypothetical protein